MLPTGGQRAPELLHLIMLSKISYIKEATAITEMKAN